MAIRSMWSGQIQLGAVPIPAKIYKATQADENDERFKRLCACCHQPFSRHDDCPAGNHPATTAALERGDDDLTEIVYGVQTGGDDDNPVFTVVSEGQLDDIAEVNEAVGLEVERVIPRAQMPTHMFEGLYFVGYANEKKKRTDKGNKDAFALLASTLASTKQALVVQWRARTNVRLGCIYPINHEGMNLMVLSLVPFATEVREPEPRILGHNDGDVSAKGVQMMTAMLGSIRGDFVHQDFQNRTVEIRAMVVEALRNEDEIPEAPTRTPVDESKGILELLAAEGFDDSEEGTWVGPMVDAKRKKALA